MTKLNLGLDEALATTRTVRRGLDLERPVDDTVLRECFELAHQSPTGSNAQSWQWIVVRDPERRRRIAALYRQAFDIYETLPDNAAGIYSGPDTERRAQHQRVMDSARHLASNLAAVPALIIPCATPRVDEAPHPLAAATYGSILPGVWSFMLAARERGLGTAWTTLHLLFEEAVAEIVGVPYHEVSQLAMIAVGHSTKQTFGRARRAPVDTFVHWETW